MFGATLDSNGVTSAGMTASERAPLGECSPGLVGHCRGVQRAATPLFLGGTGVWA